MKLANRNKAGKAYRVRTAQERAAEYAKLTPIQKLEALDEKFGKGKGAAKQRAKLLAMLKK